MIVDEILTILGHQDSKKAPSMGAFIRLLATNSWPKATKDEYIITSEGQKRERAVEIFKTIGDIKGKNILDFGCGDGSCVRAALDLGAKSAIGYDPYMAFSDIDKITGNKYDIIMAYDVIDHIGNQTALEKALSTIRECAHKETLIYIRMHPFISRHGGHSYYDVNKAFAHFFISHGKVRRIKRPDLFYDRNLKQYFTIEKRETIKTNVEYFFKTKHFTNKFMEFFENEKPETASKMFDIMSVDFIDYFLRIL